MRIDEKKEVRLTGDGSVGSVRLGAQKSRWLVGFLLGARVRKLDSNYVEIYCHVNYRQERGASLVESHLHVGTGSLMLLLQEYCRKSGVQHEPLCELTAQPP